MSEEIEIQVRAAEAHNTDAIQPASAIVQKLVLAGIGVVAQTRDETEAFINRLAAQAQQQSEHALQQAALRLQPKTPREHLEQLEVSLETQFEHILDRFNIPSKRDIDDLTAKIAQLSARVEELQRKP